MDKSPLVSVIVPVYKVEKYIETCLNSLINQTYSNWEAILVDDGSPDRSGEICDEYARRDSRFKVIHKENGGQSSARNLALNIINGSYITYLDSDDFLSSDALKYLCETAIQNNADIVQCGFLRGAEDSFPSIEGTWLTQLYDNHTVFTKFATKIIPWGKLYRRDTVGNIRFPEGLINEDDFTTWKYYYNANRIVVTDKPLYYYTCNPNSTMAQKAKRPNFKYFDAYRERIRFFQARNEPNLVAVSHIQLMKSLVLTYSNPMLSEEQRSMLRKTFRSNYDVLCQLSFKTPTKLAIIFKAFNVLPGLTSKLVVKLHN